MNISLLLKVIWPLGATIGALWAFGARVTPQEAAEKWSRRLGGATEDIRKGIERVTEAPGAAAARQQDKMRTKVLQSIDDGTWAARVGSVTLQDWKNAAINKGVQRVSQGANDARPKMASFMSELLPAVDAARAEIASMPSISLDDNVARMTSYVRRMAQFKRSR